MNGWNLTHSVINVGIIDFLHNQTRFVNTRESDISGRFFLSYNGPWQEHLCHTDTFVVTIEFCKGIKGK